MKQTQKTQEQVHAENAVAFMDRSEMKGGEASAFIEARNMLVLIANGHLKVINANATSGDEGKAAKPEPEDIPDEAPEPDAK